MSIETVFGGIKALAVWMLSTAIKAESTEPLDIDGRTGIVLPNDRKWQDITDDVARREQYLYDLEEKRGSGPRRIKGVEVAQTLEGFCALVNRHKGSTTKIDAEIDPAGKPRLVAKIDYHGASDGEIGPDPRWCDHWVVYEFPFSRQFLQWRAAAHNADKRAFLDWVDRNYVDIAYPGDVPRDKDGHYGPVTDYYFKKVMMAKSNFTDEQRQSADLNAVFGTALDLLRGARQLSASTSESLNETKDEDGCASFEWKRADKLVDPVKVKRYYLVELRVFEGDTVTRTIPCELVTNVSNGCLSLRIDLLGVEKIVEAAFEDARKAVEKATGLLPMRVESKVRATT